MYRAVVHENEQLLLVHCSIVANKSKPTSMEREERRETERKDQREHSTLKSSAQLI